MSAEENKALVRRFLDEQARGNLGVIDELLSPDFVDRGLLPGQGPTREDFKRTMTEILEAFSILSFTIEDQIAEGDRVVTRWTARASHLGELNGIPPTGKQVSISGIDVDRFENGRVVECWTLQDDLGMMRQLGVI